MVRTLPLLLLALAVPAAAQRNDQRSALAQREQGRLLPSPEIVRRTSAVMKGAQYLGFDFDGGSGMYTLKFLRNGQVIWVEVDGRTGQIVGRTDR